MGPQEAAYAGLVRDDICSSSPQDVSDGQDQAPATRTSAKLIPVFQGEVASSAYFRVFCSGADDLVSAAGQPQGRCRQRKHEQLLCPYLSPRESCAMLFIPISRASGRPTRQARQLLPYPKKEVSYGNSLYAYQEFD